jgi:hypothetical protein
MRVCAAAGRGTSITSSGPGAGAGRRSGRPVSFILAVLIILVCAATGPIFHFSDAWQLVINTGTTSSGS